MANDGTAPFISGREEETARCSLTSRCCESCGERGSDSDEVFSLHNKLKPSFPPNKRVCGRRKSGGRSLTSDEVSPPSVCVCFVAIKQPAVGLLWSCGEAALSTVVFVCLFCFFVRFSVV